MAHATVQFGTILLLLLWRTQTQLNCLYEFNLNTTTPQQFQISSCRPWLSMWDQSNLGQRGTGMINHRFRWYDQYRCWSGNNDRPNGVYSFITSIPAHPPSPSAYAFIYKCTWASGSSARFNGIWIWPEDPGKKSISLLANDNSVFYLCINR